MLKTLTKGLFGAALLAAALCAGTSPLARLKRNNKAQARAKSREQARKEREAKRKQLLKVYDDLLLRADVLAERVALHSRPAAKPRPQLARKARPRLRKP